MHLPNQKPIMFYDGGCKLCRREVALYRWLDRQQRIQWLDIHARPQVLTAFGIELSDAMRQLHVMDAQGQMQIGVDAFVALWQQMRGFGWLAKLAQLSPINHLLEIGYQRFACVRYARRCRESDSCRL